MCQRAKGTAESVVFPVVHRVLEEVSLADRVLAVVAIGLVGVEVDLPEKSDSKLEIVLGLEGLKTSGCQDVSVGR